MDDWQKLLAAVTSLLVAGGGLGAALTSWRKQGTETSKLTLDGVFLLVNELQEEVNRKNIEYIEMDKRCQLRIKALECGQEESEKTIRFLQTEISTLRFGTTRGELT